MNQSSQKQLFAIVFDCFNGTTCFAFRNYFQHFHRNFLNTRNNGKGAKLPKMKVDFYFLGASLFKSLLLSLRTLF